MTGFLFFPEFFIKRQNSTYIIPTGEKKMWDIHMRILAEGEYIAETGSTVRAAAEHFDISKSTVHTVVT